MLARQNITETHSQYNSRKGKKKKIQFKATKPFGHLQLMQ